MKNITLPTGEIAIVDDEDYLLVCNFRWKRKREPSGSVYVAASVPHPRGYGQTTILLHRILLGAPKGSVVDHRDGNPLNNIRSNIRLSTDLSNIRSFQSKRRGKTSKYRGVYWNRHQNKWIASICVRKNGVMTHPFRAEFTDERAAAMAFNDAATKLGFLPEALNKVEAA